MTEIKLLPRLINYRLHNNRKSCESFSGKPICNHQRPLCPSSKDDSPPTLHLYDCQDVYLIIWQ